MAAALVAAVGALLAYGHWAWAIAIVLIGFLVGNGGDDDDVQ